ncbi:U11/U12 small nuclear ribonucleoprotein 48 kDa protein [Quillaja saponaria]|uniref:U11/U12 small nuclear ribonucleoprotein 48 kDa protein n=1 Tax=Quillaja saponaria TaxID=32244 RepID=A0AAD7QCA1_QUISA|nr:U11/U12 small nuclear ribonucleoprotein 48 kDa protein [Quillaja saponaria]
MAISYHALLIVTTVCLLSPSSTTISIALRLLAPFLIPMSCWRSLSYTKTLKTSDELRKENRFVETLVDFDSELCFSLDDFVDFGTNFFYRDCPGAVCLSNEDGIKRTFTLPCILSVHCVNFTGTSHIELKDSEKQGFGILPSEFLDIKCEVEAWNDYPSGYSFGVLRAILGMGMVKECDLMRWMIVNSPRYGVVIDIAMRDHMFSLFSLCLKAIRKEASSTKDMLVHDQALEMSWANMCFKCPILFKALTWLTFQLSILYGEANGKFFGINLLKQCILDAASFLSLFPLDQKVAAAVAALHERSLLEEKIKGLWVSQQPTKYQLITEHSYVSHRADEERKKRPDYRPIIDHDGIPRQQSYNQETGKAKTREELLAEERDYKRRRMSYRGSKVKRTTLQVMRNIIEDYMEEIKEAGGIGRFVKESEEGGALKPPSGHGFHFGAGNLRKSNYEPSATTKDDPSQYRQHPQSNYNSRFESVKDASIRDCEQPRQGDYRSLEYIQERRITGRGKHNREYTSRSPERQRSSRRSHERSSHNRKQDYSSERKYDQKARFKDQEKSTYRNRSSHSPTHNAFEDRYNPLEPHVMCEDEFSSPSKHVRTDKVSGEEHY